jgi:putative transposase
VADIAYAPTCAGFPYLAVALDALLMAAAQRRPTSVVRRPDRGRRFAALAFGRRCRVRGVRPFMSSRGDADDGAMAESLLATLERELLARRRFACHAEAWLALLRWIEGWDNPFRRLSALGQSSPIAFEPAYAADRAAPASTPAAARASSRNRSTDCPGHLHDAAHEKRRSCG